MSTLTSYTGHDIPLPGRRSIHMLLPDDLTLTEAARITKFVRSLAVDGVTGDADVDHETAIMRTGRHIARTIYLTPPDDPDGDGRLIGLVDTPEIATTIAQRWNAAVMPDE